MLPLPCGDGTVAYSALMRESVGRHLLRRRVVRHQLVDDGRGRRAGDGDLLHAVHERTAVDVAVDVQVVSVNRLAWHRRFRRLHNSSS